MPVDEPTDRTEELMKSVEKPETIISENEDECNTRSFEELMTVNYDNMTDDERKFMFSALKVKMQELDNIVKKAFEENRRVRDVNNTNLKLMEDTLTFIKTSVGNTYGAISLAIKNMEREVK